MSSHQWYAVYQMIQRVHRRLPRPKRKPVYNDALIVAMYFLVGASRSPAMLGLRSTELSPPVPAASAAVGLAFQPTHPLAALPSDARGG